MDKVILVCVSLIILGLSWIIYRRNFELFLCLLIAVYNNLFYLAPRIHGPEDYQLLLLPIVLILLVVNLFTRELAFGRYGWGIIAFLGISVFGVVVAWLIAGQGLSFGIKAAKLTPLVLVYFLLAGRRIESEKFASYFISMALAVAFIALMQYFAHGRTNLFPGMPKEVIDWQKGFNRVGVGQIVIAASTVVAFTRYQQSSRIIFLFAAIALFAEVILVEQIRGFIVGILLSMFVIYMLSHKLSSLRISVYIFFGCLCLCSWLLLSSFLSGDGFSNLSLVKRTQADFSKRGGSFGSSYQARLNAYDYYWRQIQKNPITGRGLWNFNWEGDNEKRLQQYQGIHLSDIGITHFIVQAGLIGSIWLVWGLLKLWKDIFQFRCQLAIASYYILATFTMPTLDLFFRSDSLLLFAVFLGMSSKIITANKSYPVLANG